MKPSTVKKALLGVVFAAGASVTPIIPQDMELQYSYQYNVAEAELAEQKELETVTSSTEALPESAKPPKFEDKDGNGIVSVSVFTNRKGEVIYTQIEDERYGDMGKVGGYAQNPEREELVSALEILTPKAKAAIAYDAATVNNTGSTPTTVTFSHTVASQSDRILMVSVNNNSVVSSQIASVTYNGSALTSIRRDVGTVGGGVGTVESFYLLAPSTGANNVVVTQGATKSTFVGTAVGSYYGVAQTSPIDVSGYSESPTALWTVSATTATDNTWAWVGAFSQRNLTANTNVTLRAGSGASIVGGDTNADQTPAGLKAIILNVSSSPFTTWGHAIFIKPAVAATPIKRQVIFFNE